MKLAPGTPIKYNSFTGRLWHKPDARYDKRTDAHRPPYEAYWFVPDFDHAASGGFWVRVDDPVIVVLKLPIMGPWCDTDVWVDKDGDWWVRTPLDQVFFVQGPQNERNLSLWLACLHQWNQAHPTSVSFPPLASFEGQLHPLVLVIQELP